MRGTKTWFLNLTNASELRAMTQFIHVKPHNHIIFQKPLQRTVQYCSCRREELIWLQKNWHQNQTHASIKKKEKKENLWFSVSAHYKNTVSISRSVILMLRISVCVTKTGSFLPSTTCRSVLQAAYLLPKLCPSLSACMQVWLSVADHEYSTKYFSLQSGSLIRLPPWCSC